MKSKILLALTLLLGASTTIWASRPIQEKQTRRSTHIRTKNVWAAYEGFNNTLLDSNNIFTRQIRPIQVLLTVQWSSGYLVSAYLLGYGNECYKLAKAQKDRKKTVIIKHSARKYSQGTKRNIVSLILMITMKITGWFIYDDIMWWTISLHAVTSFWSG